MTREEAVRELIAMKPHIEPDMSVVGADAYDMAIEALKSQSSREEMEQLCIDMQSVRITGNGALGDKRPSWCPLAEIPTPHGDLVDRHKFGEALISSNPNYSQRYSIRKINSALTESTIIEAEE